MIQELAKREGTTIFLCTHQLRYAQEICTRYGLIEKGKLPVIEITDPQSVSGRAGEYWVYLPAWNNGLKLAYESRPKEIRDGWLMWLGLGEPR